MVLEYVYAEPSYSPIPFTEDLEVHVTRAGDPVALVTPNAHYEIASIQNRWRVDDLRFLRARSFVYFTVELDSGETVTLSHDCTDDSWEIRRNS